MIHPGARFVAKDGCHGPEFADMRKLQETTEAPNEFQEFFLDFVTDVSYLQQTAVIKILIKNMRLQLITGPGFV